jgi:hypothetical protein
MPVFKLNDTPVLGQEQPVSTTTRESTAWTEVDVSAAFPATAYGSKKEIIALVAQGHDHYEDSTAGFAEMRFREAGMATTWEDARGVSGYGNFIYLEGTDYAGGGVAEVITIPVSSAGKFDYWVKNHAYPPRSIVRIIWCVTEADIASSVSLLPKTSKVDSDTEDFPRLSLLQGTDAESYVLEFDSDVSQKAHWDVYEGICGSKDVHVHIVWTAQGGAGGVRWDISVGGTQDNDVWDVALVTQSASDTLLAVGDTHVCSLDLPAVPGAGAEFDASTLTHLQLMRDHDHIDDTLAAKAQLLYILIEPDMPTIFP